MATFDLKPTRDGARITLMSDDRETSVSTDRTRSEVEQLVRNLCRVAGLDKPWPDGSPRR